MKLFGLFLAIFALVIVGAAPAQAADMGAIGDILEKLSGIVGKLPEIVAAVMAVLTSLIALCLLIPGEQPEKALQGIVDFLAKFSKK